jgi:hypothetical protein
LSKIAGSGCLVAAVNQITISQTYCNIISIFCPGKLTP